MPPSIKLTPEIVTGGIVNIFPLEWQRPRDGVELVEDGPPFEGQIVKGLIARAVSGRVERLTYRLTNLEDPVSIHLVNAVSNDELVAFVSRFGFLNEYGGGTWQGIAEINVIRRDIEEIFTLPDRSDPHSKMITDHIDRITFLNERLDFLSSVRAAVDFYEGRFRLGLQPANLADFAMLEAATAIDIGATFRRCEQCSKGFLVGPLTGRRSHSVYCSDRCRVAAMRARNKG